MGYNTSSAVVNKVASYLNHMLTANELRWAVRNPNKVAYQIREALTVAKKKGIEPYANLKDQFIIKCSDTMVMAVRKVEEGTLLTMPKLEIADVDNVEGIVGAVLEHNANEFFFPDAVIEENRVLLYEWLRERKYFVVFSEEGTTVTRNDPGEAAWNP